MSCAVCGEICQCSSEAQTSSPSAAGIEQRNDGCARNEPRPLPPETAGAAAPPAETSSAWRDEVSVRLNRYNSRRKPKPPRYPSLQLPIGKSSPSRSAAECSIFAQRTHDSLAFDTFSRAAHPSGQAQSAEEVSLEVSPAIEREQRNESSSDALAFNPVVFPTAKIIEFPRPWTPPAPPADQLAEPVIAYPRILEAPEIVPPPPALGGITIEPAQQLAIERRPGIDFPLQSAPLWRRIFAAAVDDLIVGASGAIFALVFWKMTAMRPPAQQFVEMAAGTLILFWAAYHYLLIVYSGSTPGLRLARLKLCRFDGTSTNRSLRRWRVLASFLSAFSLGMGYGWVFLDEDSLCWHDRITHTYLAPKG